MIKSTQKKYQEIALKFEGHAQFDSEINNVKAFVRASSLYMDLTEKYRNSYFWTPNANAKGRRKQEEDNSFENTFSIFDKEVELSFQLSVSCRNYRVYKNLDLKDLKLILKEIQTILYVMGFDKYKDIIDSIDNLVNAKANDNDILFTQEYYTKQVEKFFSTKLISKDKKVKMSKVDRDILEQKRKEKQSKVS